MTKLAVVAIGGNSLIKDNKHSSVANQYQVVSETCKYLADLVQAGYNIVVAHGNGPQVGFTLMRSELASNILDPVPLDSCVTETQGLIGTCFSKTLRTSSGREV